LLPHNISITEILYYYFRISTKYDAPEEHGAMPGFERKLRQRTGELDPQDHCLNGTSVATCTKTLPLLSTWRILNGSKRYSQTSQENRIQGFSFEPPANAHKIFLDVPASEVARSNRCYIFQASSTGGRTWRFISMF
jgi:hypothetical protein